MSEDNPHSSNGSAPKSWFEKIGQLFHAEPKNQDELIEVIKEAQTNGLFDTDIAQMIEGVLEVDDLRVRDIMIPRSQMVTIDVSQTVEEFMPTMLESAHSRFPVITEDKDHIEGILLAKDLLPFAFDRTGTEFSLEDILRPAVVVPESKRVDVMLKEFRADRYHMAIVVDEYGGVSGLVTIEDILEVIVGEIEDETDDVEDDACDIRQVGKRLYAVQALTQIDQFNEAFETHFSDEEFDTIGGMVVNAFGHMPERGESIKIDGFTFKVMATDTRRVSQLQVKVSKKTVEEAVTD
ncbi:CNNM family magnesium/cobalt transport protein CorC [Echinimonas agarilytica]|uniref:Magnesium and cobalt efflux protein CorC n=1 Tax=Echinimonas agarilytica TaxID=1215918 RepID=A0AA41W516_9GAMM|nr:CNNM family magnesium/cobalt transport protein CorC [Echinimonas agarilytica]MCM2679092.1 CNNM family magnesium/cobalt transport protein CorC [Echinimonas agarilytica]